jgi:hypothetical protein
VLVLGALGLRDRKETDVLQLTGLSQLEGVAARETALDGHRDQRSVPHTGFSS